MDRHTLYYVTRSGGGGGDIGPIYRASFRLQRGNGKGNFFRGPFRFVKPLLYSGAKAFRKEATRDSIYLLIYLIRNLDSWLAIFSKRALVKRRITLNRKLRK